MRKHLRIELFVFSSVLFFLWSSLSVSDEPQATVHPNWEINQFSEALFPSEFGFAENLIWGAKAMINHPDIKVVVPIYAYSPHIVCNGNFSKESDVGVMVFRVNNETQNSSELLKPGNAYWESSLEAACSKLNLKYAVVKELFESLGVELVGSSDNELTGSRAKELFESWAMGSVGSGAHGLTDSRAKELFESLGVELVGSSDNELTDSRAKELFESWANSALSTGTRLAWKPEDMDTWAMAAAKTAGKLTMEHENTDVAEWLPSEYILTIDPVPMANPAQEFWWKCNDGAIPKPDTICYKTLAASPYVQHKRLVDSANWTNRTNAGYSIE